MRRTTRALYILKNPRFSYLILILLFLSYLLFTDRVVDEVVAGGIDYVRIARGLLLGLILLLLAWRSLLYREFKWLKVLRHPIFIWISMYAGWALLSASYSGNPFLSLAKGYEICVDILVAAFIFGQIYSLPSLERLWKSVMLLLLALVVSYVLISIIGGRRMIDFIGAFPIWTGFGGRNGLTQIGAILGLFSLSRMLAGEQRWRILYFQLLIFSIFVMLISYSRTSIFIFSALALVIMIRNRKVGLLVTGALIFGIVLLVSFDSVYAYILRGQEQKEFVGLTGRIDFIWIGAISLIVQSPIIGYGYYYGTTYLAPLVIYGGYDKPFTNVDNTFLEVALNLGLVGVSIFLLIWLDVFRKMKTLLRSKSNLLHTLLFLEVSLVLLSTFIRSWVNPTIAYHHWNTIVFLICSIVVLKLERSVLGNTTEVKE